MDWTDIEARLRARVEDVCRHLFPNGKREGGEWVVGSLAGEAGKSLKINLAGKLGVWRDFAGESGGKSLLSLWMHAKQCAKFGAAVCEAKEFLGIRDDFEKRVRPYGSSAGRTAAALQQDDSTWRAVADLWARCEPLTDKDPQWDYLVKTRKLAPEALEVFQVRGCLSNGRAVMVFPYFVPPEEDAFVLEKKAAIPAWLKFELVARVDGKKREWTSKAPDKILYGMQMAEHPLGKRCRDVLICEGEKDAMAWASYGCMEWGILPLSVPFGAKWKGQDKGRPSPNREWLDRSWEWLNDFEMVYVQMDRDEAGQRAAADIIAEIGPRRCRLVTLPAPCKDANECLQKNTPREAMKTALDTARDFAPDKIVAATDLEEDFLKWVFERAVDAGVELPFEFPLRFRPSETTLWLGIEKSGKTTLLNFATVAAMYQGERALVASFEVPWTDTNDKLCRQAFGGLYFDKRTLKRCASDVTRANYLASARLDTVETHRWLAKSLWYYVHVGIGNWRTLLDDIRWARRRLGITWVVIDNFMRLGIPKDDYAQQADCIIALVSLFMELGIHGHVVLHQNKSEGQKGNAGGKRTASGAHELLGNPHNIVEVQRDDKKGKQVAELWEEKKLGAIEEAEFAQRLGALDLKPDGRFIMHAQRNGDVQDGSKGLWFLWESQQFAGVPKGHKDYSAMRFVATAKQQATPLELPTNEEMGIK
jgi:twinkle protein